MFTVSLGHFYLFFLEPLALAPALHVMRALRYAMSEIRKHANRVGFNVAEAEVQGGSDHTKSLGMLGHAGMSGKVCAAHVVMAGAALHGSAVRFLFYL